MKIKIKGKVTKIRYMNRYIHTFAIMLAALLAVGTAKAQAQSTGVRIHGSVYGGGNNADVQTNTAVNISAGQVEGNVFGGGESSYVTGASNKVTVNIEGNTQVLGNVFGGGDEGVVEGSAEVNIKNED